MGQKDLREKLLEDYEDVFSDIFNVLLFEKNVIQQQYLKASSTESVYKAENGEYHNQIRDILKECMNSCLLEIGSLGMENQSTLDNYIAVRVMGYDYTKYRSQTDRKKRREVCDYVQCGSGIRRKRNRKRNKTGVYKHDSETAS